MHWIRVDRYIEGPPDQPDAFHFQPLPCMHCENAPCEYVCPVAATVHSYDGLNEMIYQRCVGTRFCSNNCPYKVRRFNFLFFADFIAERRMQYNPDVTVRSRGVMEKCSYCVQRIREGEIGAEASSGRWSDGEVLTACQAACPTQAIVFGNMNDPQPGHARQKLAAGLFAVGRFEYASADDVFGRTSEPNPELDLEPRWMHDRQRRCDSPVSRPTRRRPTTFRAGIRWPRSPARSAISCWCGRPAGVFHVVRRRAHAAADLRRR